MQWGSVPPKSPLVPRAALMGVPVDDRLVLLGLLDELVEGLEVVVYVVGALEEVAAVHGVRVVAHAVVVRVTRGQVVLVGHGRPLGGAGRVARVGVLKLLKIESRLSVNSVISAGKAFADGKPSLQPKGSIA